MSNNFTKYKWFSRKFIIVLLWWGLLLFCCILDGEFVQSGFCMVLAITGCIVSSVFMLGSYLKDITTIKFGHKDTTVELTMKEKSNEKSRSKN